MWAQSDGAEETTTTEPAPTSTTPMVTADVPDYEGVYIPREVWGGADPTRPATKAQPALLLVIKHTAGETCANQKQCSKVVREIQKEHMEGLGLADISYNFLVGGDGKIYNGRGWGVQNEGRNDSLDVAFMGNFNVDDPTTKMMNAALRIQITGQSTGWVKYGKYRVLNHNQTEPTDSPGKRLFAKTISYLNYYSGAVCYHNSSGQVVIDYGCPWLLEAKESWDVRRSPLVEEPRELVNCKVMVLSRHAEILVSLESEDVKPSQLSWLVSKQLRTIYKNCLGKTLPFSSRNFYETFSVWRFMCFRWTVKDSRLAKIRL